MATEISNSFTVRFIRNGDQIYFTKNIVSFDASGNETGGAFYQSIDPNDGTVNPDWSVTTNQPVLKLGISSARKNPITVTDVLWAFDGANIIFPSPISTDWVSSTSHSGAFQQRLINTGSVYYAELKVVSNIASKSADVVSNRQISYTLTYVCNALKDTFSGTQDVFIQQSGSTSHWANIVTPRVELSSESVATQSTTLTAKCYYGSHNVTVGQNGYTMKWFKDGVEISGATTDTITVTRDDVNGGSVYVVQLLLNGTIVASDGQRINDISDEYRVEAYTPDGSNDALSENQNAIFGFRIKKNGTVITSSSDYTVSVYNSIGVLMRTATVASGATLTLTKNDALCSPVGGTAYYADVDIDITTQL